MGCNCRKNRPPLGARTARKATVKKDEETKEPRTQKFTLLREDGVRQTFGSFLEADAARVRAGGGSIR